MTYSEKLKDPRWQRKRLEVLNRANFSCEKCQDHASTLHVHHKYYVSNRLPWEYPDWCLIALLAETPGDHCDESLAKLYLLACEKHNMTPRRMRSLLSFFLSMPNLVDYVIKEENDFYTQGEEDVKEDQ